MNRELSIPWEVADGITLANLKEIRESLKTQLENHIDGTYMHDDDIVYNTKIVQHLEAIIDYFGG
jgi:hypothetical protein